jgi:ATP-binding cassette subfamily C (CFTR/MRP) protein 4
LSLLISRLTNPLLLGLLIGFFTHNPHNFSTNDAYLIATGIVLTLILPLLFFHPFMLFLFDEAMKLRIACCSLIYTKVMVGLIETHHNLRLTIPLQILTFTKYTMKEGIAGQAVNLMSNDVSRFDWFMSFTHDVWLPPLASAVAGYFIYQQVQFAGLLGMAILILFMPLQGEFGIFIF